MSVDNPYNRVCCIDKYYHLYLSKFLRKAFKDRNIPTEDFYAVPIVDKVENIYPIYERCFNKYRGKKNSVKKACWLFARNYIILTSCCILFEAAVATCGAFLLGGLLKSLVEVDENYSDEAMHKLWGYFSGLLICTFIYPVVHPITFFAMYQISYKTRVVLTVLIYRKVLVLKNYMLSQTSSGEVLNIISTDLGKVDFLGIFLIFFIIFPVYFVVKVIASYFVIGWPGVFGCGLFLLLIPVQLSFTSMFSKYRRQSAMYADQRVKLMREVIEGIRVIKMYVWEESFKRLIKKIRLLEVNELIKVHILNGFNYGINAGSPQIVTMSTVLVTLYVQKDHILPDTLFAYMLLMGDLRFYAQMYTLSLPYVAEINIALNRIQKLVDINEDPNFYNPASKDEGNEQTRTSAGSTTDPGADYVPEVVLNNVHATHDSFQMETNTGFDLQDVTFTAEPAELIMVVGATGSGKSSVLMCLIEEMVLLRGTRKRVGSVAYAAQEAWIMAGTVQENILFGLPLKPKFYSTVVAACSLIRDFEIMPDGDQTVVGERGVMLSGGQKARICLARAAYRDADIVLLDDPLSAVDNHVSKALFEQCIRGLMKDKIVFLATHQLQYLPKATKVLLIKSGRMLACGSASDLINQGFDIGDIVKTPVMSDIDATPAVELDQNSNAVYFQGSSSRSHSFVASETRSLDNERGILRSGRGGDWIAMKRMSDGDPEGKVAAAALLRKRSRKNDVAHSFTTYAHKSSVLSFSSMPVFVADTVVLNDMGSEMDKMSHQSEKGKIVPKVLQDQEGAPLKITGVEDEQVGSISCALYVYFFKLAGPVPATLLVILLGLGAVGLQIAADKFLSSWSNNNERVAVSEALSEDLGVPKYNNGTEIESIGLKYHDLGYVRIYVVLVSLFVLFNGVASATFSVIVAKASERLHNLMFERLLHVVTKFFDMHPSGQILNKFSKDVGIADNDLNRCFFDFSRLFYMTIGFYVAVIVTNIYVLALSVPLIVVFIVLRVLYLPGSRAIKRKEAIARSPVFSHVSVTLSSLCSIHAYKQDQYMSDNFDSHLDAHTGFWFLFIAASRWLGVLVDFIMALFQAIVLVVGVLFSLYDVANLSPSDIGFMLSYTFAMLGMTQYMVRQSCEVDNLMTSIERMKEYTNLPVEGKADKPLDPPDGWPEKGTIQLIDVSLSYETEDGDVHLALTELNLTIEHGEKIGVCGRTGAGKSSLMVLLTRLFEINSGKVLIDGVDCSKLSLARLRKAISIIPQDPVLFSRSVRENLDPFGEYSEKRIEEALEKVELLESVRNLPSGLDTTVAEGGSNFSVGQRQLMCLARALLCSTKILLVDEATANVDYATDELIQKTLRDVFADTTVLTIAHRLNTILDSTRVIVMDTGRIVEEGPPEELRKNRNGYFYALISHQVHQDQSISSSDDECSQLLETQPDESTFVQGVGIANREGLDASEDQTADRASSEEHDSSL